MNDIVIHKQKDIENPGIVMIPYIMIEHDEESLKEYKKFMINYKSKHKFCPKCGSTNIFWAFGQDRQLSIAERSNGSSLKSRC